MHVISTANWRLLGNEKIWSLNYGFFEIPSPFSLVIGTYTIIILLGKFNVTKPEKVLLITAMLFSESRIGTGAFFIVMVAISRYRIQFLLGTILIYITLLFSKSYFKAVSFLTLTSDKLSKDPSLNMRLENMESMIKWWDVSDTFLFGGGVLSHMEYSVFFNRVGPLDSLYLKLFSDFGLISIIILILIVVALFVKYFNTIKKNNEIILGPILFVSIYSVLNEGLVSIKSGHLVFFLIGICFWYSKLHNVKSNQ
jgi:hypothetical protein